MSRARCDRHRKQARPSRGLHPPMPQGQTDSLAQLERWPREHCPESSPRSPFKSRSGRLEQGPSHCLQALAAPCPQPLSSKLGLAVPPSSGWQLPQDPGQPYSLQAAKRCCGRRGLKESGTLALPGSRRVTGTVSSHLPGICPAPDDRQPDREMTLPGKHAG